MDEFNRDPHLGGPYVDNLLDRNEHFESESDIAEEYAATTRFGPVIVIILLVSTVFVKLFVKISNINVRNVERRCIIL